MTAARALVHGLEAHSRSPRQPEHHAPHARCIGHGHQHTDDGAARAGERHSSQQKAWGAAASSKQVYDADGAQRADDSCRLHDDNRSTGNHCEQPTHGRAP